MEETKQIEQPIEKTKKIGIFKAMIFCVNKTSKSKKKAGKVYTYGALSLQTPKLAPYIGKHVLMKLSVIQGEPKTDEAETSVDMAESKVMPEKIPMAEKAPSSQDAKREDICEQCTHWQFGHDTYLCMKFQGDNGQKCVDMNFESFEQKKAESEKRIVEQIPQPGANAVKLGADVGLAPANDVGGTSPPEAANTVTDTRREQAPTCKCGKKMQAGYDDWICPDDTVDSKVEHGNPDRDVNEVNS